MFYLLASHVNIDDLARAAGIALGDALGAGVGLLAGAGGYCLHRLNGLELALLHTLRGGDAGAAAVGGDGQVVGDTNIHACNVGIKSVFSKGYDAFLREPVTKAGPAYV